MMSTPVDPAGTADAAQKRDATTALNQERGRKQIQEKCSEDKKCPRDLPKVLACEANGHKR